MRSTGLIFENLALAHVQREGLVLITRNFTSRFGELDLVMRDRETVVFLEVRYRRSQAFGGALESVGTTKRDRLGKEREKSAVELDQMLEADPDPELDAEVERETAALKHRSSTGNAMPSKPPEDSRCDMLYTFF